MASKQKRSLLTPQQQQVANSAKKAFGLDPSVEDPDSGTDDGEAEPVDIGRNYKRMNPGVGPVEATPSSASVRKLRMPAAPSAKKPAAEEDGTENGGVPAWAEQWGTNDNPELGHALNDMDGSNPDAAEVADRDVENTKKLKKKYPNAGSKKEDDLW